VNSFVGVNVANLTGGVLSADNLFQSNNFACFAFQLLEQGIPDFATKILNALDPVTSLVNKYVGPVLGGLACPQLGQFDNVSPTALSLSRDVRTVFANTSDRCRASLIPSLAATTTRLGLTPTTRKSSEGFRGELVSLQGLTPTTRKSSEGFRGELVSLQGLTDHAMAISMAFGQRRLRFSCAAVEVGCLTVDWIRCLYRAIDGDSAISTMNVTYNHLRLPPLTIGACVGYAIAFLLVSIFQCRLIPMAWETRHGEMHGVCNDTNAQLPRLDLRRRITINVVLDEQATISCCVARLRYSMRR
jgi:hypothetical protein